MPGKQNCADADKAIPFGQTEAFCYAQEIHTGHPCQDRKPDQPGILFPEEQKVDNRHQKHIHRCNKPGFPGRCINNACLLEDCSRNQEKPAADTAEDCFFAIRFLHTGRTTSFHCQGNQTDRQRRRPHSGGSKRQRFNALHPCPLSNKGGTPDHCCQEQKNIAKCFSVPHLSTDLSSVCPGRLFFYQS